MWVLNKQKKISEISKTARFIQIVYSQECQTTEVLDCHDEYRNECTTAYTEQCEITYKEKVRQYQTQKR